MDFPKYCIILLDGNDRIVAAFEIEGPHGVTPRPIWTVILVDDAVKILSMGDNSPSARGASSIIRTDIRIFFHR